MPTPDSARSLRRAANRPALRGRRPSDSLVSNAHAGVLNRDNTKPGTRGRQAVYRAEAERRQLSHPFESPRKALGHESVAEREARRMSLLLDAPPLYAELGALGRRDRSRVARYDALVSNLAQGRITAAAFRRRVSRWAPIGDQRFLADPAAVLALLEQRRAAGLDTFLYEGRAA